MLAHLYLQVMKLLYRYHAIRIERLEKREKQKFGDRILPDGDMYTTHMKFMEWVRAYDTGSVEMRSKAKHDE